MPRPAHPHLPLPLSVAAAITDALFFGFYLVTACIANRWLFFTDEGWKFRKQIHWPLAVITNLLWALIVISLGTNVNSSIVQAAFVEGGHQLEDFASPNWDPIVECTVANGIALLADIVLMYRLWIVSSKRVALMWFPIFLWVGSFVCAILQVFLQAVHIKNPDFGPYQWAKVNMDVGPGIVLTPFWGASAVLNAYCTGILIWKIWKTTKKSENNIGGNQLQFIARVLMESGFLYLAISIAHFIGWFSRDDFAINILGAMNANVIGIAFNLIIIRTAAIKAEDTGAYHISEKMTSMAFGSPVQYTDSVGIEDVTVYPSHGTHSEKSV